MNKKYLVVIIILTITGGILYMIMIPDTPPIQEQIPSNLVEVAHILTDGQVMKVQVDETYLYALSTGSNPLGFVMIDIDDPQNPAVLGSYISSWPMEFQVVNNLAYIVGDEGLEIIDVSDPSAMIQLGSFLSEELVHDLAVRDELVFMVGSSVGLSIINVSNPELPLLISHTELNGETVRVELAGEYCMISRIDGYSRIEVYDISDLSNPMYLGEYQRNNAVFFDLFVQGNYLYASDHSAAGEWYILDISVPSNIGLESVYATGTYPQGSVVVDGIAYVSDVDNGILLIDVSDPTNPILLSSYFDGGSGQDVDVQGKYIFLADRTDGLEILMYS
ncbi:MAG: hypothetical protein INQ03_23240 [Candidatus Heimdallarchaeota archaeon]|nr:hypothetical protein [Candidatus Heimdallarchaeota archaeon]